MVLGRNVTHSTQPHYNILGLPLNRSKLHKVFMWHIQVIFIHTYIWSKWSIRKLSFSHGITQTGPLRLCSTRVPMNQGTTNLSNNKICFEFFQTGFHSSERKQYSEHTLWDTGVTSLIIAGGARVLKTDNFRSCISPTCGSGKLEQWNFLLSTWFI